MLVLSFSYETSLLCDAFADENRYADLSIGCSIGPKVPEKKSLNYSNLGSRLYDADYRSGPRRSFVRAIDETDDCDAERNAIPLD